MRTKLFSALAALVFVSGAQAQVPFNATWFNVLHRPQVHVRARIVDVDGQPFVQFRNQGPDQVHFQFGVNEEDPMRNPRVHLKAHKRSAFLPLPVEATSPVLKLTLVRVGMDEGEFLPN